MMWWLLMFLGSCGGGASVASDASDGADLNSPLIAQRRPPVQAPPPELPSEPLVTRDCYQELAQNRGGRHPTYRPHRRQTKPPNAVPGQSSGAGGGVGGISGSGGLGQSGQGYGAGGVGGGVSATPSPKPSTRGPVASSPIGGATAKESGADGFFAPAPPAKQRTKRDANDREMSVGRNKPAAVLAEAEAQPRPPARRWDWGATVYLSNDDSMSLASAQRVLWASEQGRRVPLQQIRPHELLNYFHFDTTEVPDNQHFSVLASAEPDGDTLRLALSVRGALPARRPLDLTLVVDRSGSMSAEGRMSYTRRGLRLLTDQLVDGDRVDLVLFDSRVCTPLQNFLVGRDELSLLRTEIDRIRPRGATNLDAGLRTAYGIQTSRSALGPERNRRVLLLTDAQLNRGNVDEDLVSEVGRQFESHGIRLTGVGVGRDFNDRLLDKLTEKGKGAYVYLGSEAVVDRIFGQGFRALTETIAHDVQFALELPDSLAMARFYGEESSTHAEDIQPLNYYAGTTQLFLQDLHLRELVQSDPLRLTIRFRDARSGEPGVQVFDTTVGALLGADRANIRKAQALMAWSDMLVARAMGRDPCGAPLRAYRKIAANITDDVEIAYVSGLAARACGQVMPALAASVGVKVRVDADEPIAEVALSCPSSATTRVRLVGGSVARFAAVAPGVCRITLEGGARYSTTVTVPRTGGDLRCMVRGGRASCG